MIAIAIVNHNYTIGNGVSSLDIFVRMQKQALQGAVLHDEKGQPLRKIRLRISNIESVTPGKLLITFSVHRGGDLSDKERSLNFRIVKHPVDCRIDFLSEKFSV